MKKMEIISAKDALARTEDSRRIKSVAPAMEKIHTAIIEATGLQHCHVNITDIVGDVYYDCHDMIYDQLKQLGYRVEVSSGKTIIYWHHANAKEQY